jgi:hypothetical protein
MRYSLPSFWAKLGYSQIKIDRKLISLYSLQSKIGVHLLNSEQTQLLTQCSKKSFIESKKSFKKTRIDVSKISKIENYELLIAVKKPSYF